MTDANPTVIGFDLGHGETALASTRLATMDEPRVLPINGARTIPTIVGRHRDGRILIGETAGRTAAELTESYERFKSRDLSTGSVADRATKLFVGGVVAAVAPGDAAVFVGHPSGWGAATVEAYRALLRQAGLPTADVIPESRAAFIHSRESGELNLSMEELSRRVLIMDFGSSTTDFTATLGLSSQPLDFGDVALGAGIIDGLLMRLTIERSAARKAVAAALERLPGKRTELAHKCRLAKERYFNAEKADPRPLIEDIVRIDDGLTVDIELDRDVIDRILREPSPLLDGMNWLQALNDCLTRARQQVPSPDLIILTGGAARMGFVRDAVVATFPTTKVAMSQEPEFAIAKGLALYGRLLLKTEAFRAEVDTVVHGPAFRAIIQDALPDLIARQARIVGAAMAEGPVRASILRWRDQPASCPTIDDMGRQIATDCEAWVHGEEARTVIAEAVADWLETIRIRLEMLTDPLCDRFLLPKRVLSLQGQTLVPISGSGIGTPDVIGDLSAVGAIAGMIGTGTVAKVLIVVHVVLGSNPVGWAVAVISGVLAAVIGVEAAKRLLQGVNIPGFTRGWLISDSKVDALVTEASKTVTAQLQRELERNEARGPENERLSAMVLEQVGQAVRRRADDALLLLR